MKEIHRSRRLRSLRRKDPSLPQGTLTSEEDESDGDHRNLGRTNKNANRTGTTTLVETITNPTSSSDQSSLHLYSINSIPKAPTMSDDLTPLTSSATPLTQLTTSTQSKQGEGTTVQIDLTLLSSTDTLASSSISSVRDLSPHLSVKYPLPSLAFSQTDSSMKSLVFSRDQPGDSELLSFRKNSSLPTITDIGDSSAIHSIEPTLSHSQRTPIRWSPRRWNFHPLSSRVKLFIGCSSIGFLAGVVLLLVVLWVTRAIERERRCCSSHPFLSHHSCFTSHSYRPNKYLECYFSGMIDRSSDDEQANRFFNEQNRFSSLAMPRRSVENTRHWRSWKEKRSIKGTVRFSSSSSPLDDGTWMRYWFSEIEWRLNHISFIHRFDKYLDNRIMCVH